MKPHDVTRVRLTGVFTALVTPFNEKGELDEVGMPTLARRKKGEKRPATGQLSLFADDESLVLGEIASTDINALTPIEAMNLIAEWKERLKKA